METPLSDKEENVGLSGSNGGLERALIPIGYLNLWEGGYNHEEIPTFTRERQTMASLPGNYTHCWPVYDLAAILAAVELERSNVKLRGCRAFAAVPLERRVRLAGT